MKTSIPTRPYGTSGIQVSLLGLGAGHIGAPDQDEASVHALLDRALKLGITLLDTARGYGLSEERIGRWVSGKRDQVVLSTKVGYGIEGVPDWTYDAVARGIDAACARLQTDYLDIVHLHSCEKWILEQGAVIDALTQAKQAGKVRAIAYSGENEALWYALESGRFDGFEASLNICDQRLLDGFLQRVQAQGLGFIAKRPLANAPWRFPQRPTGHYCEVYWDRWQQMGLQTRDWNAAETAILFCAGTEAVSSLITGTSNPTHLEENVRLLIGGNMDKTERQALRDLFREKDHDWIGQV